MWSLYTLGDHSPTRSTCALAGRLGSIASKSNRNRIVFIFLVIFVNSRLSSGLVDAAWRGIPPRTVGNFLEMRMGYKRLDQVLRVGHYSRHRQPTVASIGVRKAIEIFFQDGGTTVRDAVFLQISRMHTRGNNLEIIRFLQQFFCDDPSTR